MHFQLKYIRYLIILFKILRLILRELTQIFLNFKYAKSYIKFKEIFFLKNAYVFADYFTKNNQKIFDIFYR